MENPLFCHQFIQVIFKSHPVRWSVKSESAVTSSEHAKCSYGRRRPLLLPQKTVGGSKMRGKPPKKDSRLLIGSAIKEHFSGRPKDLFFDDNIREYSSCRGHPGSNANGFSGCLGFSFRRSRFCRFSTRPPRKKNRIRDFEWKSHKGKRERKKGLTGKKRPFYVFLCLGLFGMLLNEGGCGVLC